MTFDRLPGCFGDELECGRVTDARDEGGVRDVEGRHWYDGVLPRAPGRQPGHRQVGQCVLEAKLTEAPPSSCRTRVAVPASGSVA